ncbi:uncharacterized protein LOC126372960 [Pectinophora gossypiella]|uniref:Uncharacterized protein n=1 Tax=Pectinophora gossypiella TaxID=13191 RepID=A0A1E1WC14_PECGO|nr:uncharacterized protein LOC126372960 [Pectinophora gossypiella]
MADMLDDQGDNAVRPSRPSLVQVRALVEFIQKHPDLAHRKLRTGVARQKVKKLWIQLSNIANSLEGTLKSTKGWIKFWSDKRRSIILKQKQIDEGKLQDTLAPIEQKIYDLCQNVTDKSSTTKRKKGVKLEPCNGNDDDSMDDLFPDSEEMELSQMDGSRLLPTEAEERQLNIMEKLVDVMDQQSQAMVQMAQAAHNNSKALERLAEASQMQALAVDRVAATFENISTSVHDVRNAIMSIDYTMKRCYSASATQQRTSSNLFS